MATPDYSGRLVPVVLFQRFTSLLGAGSFEGFAFDVRAYEGARINMWRGPLVGSGSPTFSFFFQESTDRNTWVACEGTSAGEDPGADTESQVTFALSKRWFRAYVALAGTQPGVTCWAQGFLIKRLT